MKTKQYSKIILAIVIATALIIGSITAVAVYQESAYDFSVNGISPKIGSTYFEEIPEEDFSAVVSITNKGDASSITVLLAAYGVDGQMLKAQYQTIYVGANKTSSCEFDIENADGEITALKAFLLNSEEELIPVAKAFTFRNYDVVVSAYMSSNDELVVQTIEGKEYKVTCSQNGQTSFSEYDVGSRFYLAEPSGEFDVPVYINDILYTVHFDAIYYELTRKNTGDNVWLHKSSKTSSQVHYVPYEATVYISGETDSSLAGYGMHITLADLSLGNIWGYDTEIETDGSFSIALTQGDGTSNYNVWRAPKSLVFNSVQIYNPLGEEDKDNDAPSTEELIIPLVGTWAASPTEEIVVAEDGTITYADTEYTPEYEQHRTYTLAYLADKGLDTEMYVKFDFEEGTAYCNFNDYEYIKDRTWEVVTLTTDNWSTYFELAEIFEPSYDIFGDYEFSTLYYAYSMKDEYLGNLDKELSKMSIRFTYDEYSADCTVDSVSETVSIEKPGEYYKTLEATFSHKRNLTTGTIDNYTIELNDTTTRYATNIQVDRVVGDLYFIND